MPNEIHPQQIREQRNDDQTRKDINNKCRSYKRVAKC